MTRPATPDELATLRRIFDREAPHRPHWPQDFARAVADPLTLAILRTMAAHPAAHGYGRHHAPGQAHRATTQRQRELEALPDDLDPAAPRARIKSLDWKSRAAGEKPD